MNEGYAMDEAGKEAENGKVCGAETRDGSPCQRSPIPGGSRCHLHGGGSPQARQKAKERLLAAADPAAGALVEIVKDEEARASDRIRAAKEILDRAGVDEPEEHEVRGGVDDLLVEALQEGYAEASGDV
jgi:hypothetical protein